MKDGDLNGIFDMNAYSLEGIDEIRSVLADKTNPSFHHEYNITEDYFSGDTWSRTVNWYLMKRYSVMYDPVTKSFVPMFSMPTKLFDGVKTAYTTDGQKIEVNLAKNVEPTFGNILNLYGGEKSTPPFKYTNYLGNEIINKGDKLADRAAIVLKAGDVIDLSRLPKELQVRYQNMPVVFTTDIFHSFTIDGRPFGLRPNIPIDHGDFSYCDGEVIVVRGCGNLRDRRRYGFKNQTGEKQHARRQRHEYRESSGQTRGQARSRGQTRPRQTRSRRVYRTRQRQRGRRKFFGNGTRVFKNVGTMEHA